MLITFIHYINDRGHQYNVKFYMGVIKSFNIKPRNKIVVLMKTLH